MPFRPKPSAGFPLFERSGRLPATCASLLALALAAGCSSSDHWDSEFACSGQEQSIASFAGDDPASAIRKDYPITVDFHLRSRNALVKTSMTTVDSTDNQILSFSARNQSSWINGQFNQRTGELVAIDEKTLTIAGRSQQVRTSGRYLCKPSSQSAST